MMDLHDLKINLQERFTDGLVTIVGSGLSVSEGLPGMGEIEDHLQASMPSKLKTETAYVFKEWEEVSENLFDGLNIEEALSVRKFSQTLVRNITDSVAKFIRDRERHIIDGVFSGHTTLGFSKLLPHLVHNDRGIPVITTNYDRLIEVAAETQELGCDTLCIGHVIGHFSQSKSTWSFCRSVRMKGRSKAVPCFAERIILAKPHGSLDWYYHCNKPIRSAINLNQTPLIITPGLHKYQHGYHPPFDLHRTKANDLIDYAREFLIIGYGFNDDHLQTHLETRIRQGAKTLLLTKQLSSKAENLINNFPNMWALTEYQGTEQTGTTLKYSGGEDIYPGVYMWHLTGFIKEVLEP